MTRQSTSADRQNANAVPAELPLPAPPLADAVVALRPWGRDDLPDLLAAAGDPLVHRYRYSLPASPVQARAWLAAVERDRLGGERLELAVTAPEAPRAVGSVSLQAFHARHGTATVGYWLAAADRGRGAATSAVRLLAGWAFSELGLQRLALTVEVGNVASRRVAERCGFRCEGRLRSDQQQRDGTRADVLAYGLPAGELSSD
jgi:RimJ/RimL family protein N-acetyltransferase